MMERQLVISPEAEDDVDVAFQTYERQRPELGREFVLNVHDVLERIRSMPEAHAKTHRNVRQTLVKRFPYVVCYTADSSTVRVIAVFHGHRDPNVGNRVRSDVVTARRVAQGAGSFRTEK